MQEGTFNATAKNYPEIFKGASWGDMPLDYLLAITAFAFHVKDLSLQLNANGGATSVLAHAELITIGYNQGSPEMLAAAATGQRNPDAQSYINGQDVRPGFRFFYGVAAYAYAAGLTGEEFGVPRSGLLK